MKPTIALQLRQGREPEALCTHAHDEGVTKHCLTDEMEPIVLGWNMPSPEPKLLRVIREVFHAQYRLCDSAQITERNQSVQILLPPTQGKMIQGRIEQEERILARFLGQVAATSRIELRPAMDLEGSLVEPGIPVQQDQLGIRTSDERRRKEFRMDEVLRTSSNIESFDLHAVFRQHIWARTRQTQPGILHSDLIDLPATGLERGTRTLGWSYFAARASAGSRERTSRL